MMMMAVTDNDSISDDDGSDRLAIDASVENDQRIMTELTAPLMLTSGDGAGRRSGLIPMAEGIDDGLYYRCQVTVLPSWLMVMTW